MTTASLDDPVFIGGIAGTGKTRLGSLLGRHPDIAVTRKTYLWRRYYGRYGDLSISDNLERCLADILSSEAVARLGFDRGRLESELRHLPRTYGDLFGLIHRLNAEAIGKRRWCDQLGLVEAFADAIFAAFPAAKMIHLVRDPRGPDLARQKPGALGWTMGKWVTSVSLAETNAKRHGDRYLVVRYEDLYADEAATLRLVCDFLGERFDDAIAEHVAPRRPAQDGHRVSRGGRFVERSASELMLAHGYRVAAPAQGPTITDRLVHDPANRLAMTAWRHVKLRSLTRRVGAGP